MEPYATVAANYLDSMLKALPGPKVLLLDFWSKNILNATFSHSRLLQHEVLLVSALEDISGQLKVPGSEPTIAPDGQLDYSGIAAADDIANQCAEFNFRQLSCVVIARPVQQSLQQVCDTLRRSAFKSYALYFTNFVTAEDMQMLAGSDVRQCVQVVEEVYLDLQPVTDETCLVVLDHRGAKNTLSHILGQQHSTVRDPLPAIPTRKDDFTRITEGLVALMLGQNRRPQIRYRAGSDACARIAEQVASKMRMIHKTFFDLKSKDCVLLIADRRDDPVTPLLTPWSYEAQIHTYLGIKDGIVEVDGNTNDEPAEKFVLSAAHDSFFGRHRHSNWGDLCIAVKELIESYKAVNSQLPSSGAEREKLSLKEIKDFMIKFPAVKQQSALTMKHATIVGRLGSEIGKRFLADVASVEQEVMCNPPAPKDHANLICRLIKEVEGIAPHDAVRLAVLYELRYDYAHQTSSGEIHQTIQRCLGIQEQETKKIVAEVLKYGSARSRKGELFINSSSVFKSMVNAVSAFKKESGNEIVNVLTKHKPHLKRLVNDLCHGRLSEHDYPFMQCSDTQRTVTEKDPMKEIMVFTVGGITYAEAELVHRIRSLQEPSETNRSVTQQLTTGGFVDSGVLEACVTLASTTMLRPGEYMLEIAPGTWPGMMERKTINKSVQKVSLSEMVGSEKPSGASSQRAKDVKHDEDDAR